MCVSLVACDDTSTTTTEAPVPPTTTTATPEAPIITTTTTESPSDDPRNASYAHVRHRTVLLIDFLLAFGDFGAAFGYFDKGDMAQVVEHLCLFHDALYARISYEYATNNALKNLPIAKTIPEIVSRSNEIISIARGEVKRYTKMVDDATKTSDPDNGGTLVDPSVPATVRPKRIAAIRLVNAVEDVVVLLFNDTIKGKFAMAKLNTFRHNLETAKKLALDGIIFPYEHNFFVVFDLVMDLFLDAIKPKYPHINHPPTTTTTTTRAPTPTTRAPTPTTTPSNNANHGSSLEPATPRPGPTHERKKEGANGSSTVVILFITAVAIVACGIGMSVLRSRQAVNSRRRASSHAWEGGDATGGVRSATELQTTATLL